MLLDYFLDPLLQYLTLFEVECLHYVYKFQVSVSPVRQNVYRHLLRIDHYFIIWRQMKL